MKNTGINDTRRKLLKYAASLTAVAGSASFSGNSAAAGKPVTISDFGGEWSDWNRKIFNAEFTRQTGSNVVMDAGADNAARIAKIKLGLSQGTYDIACFADVFFARAKTEGLLNGINLNSPILTNLKDIGKQFITPDYVAHLFNGLGLAYNPSMVKKPPTSWADLWDPDYKGKIVLPTVTHSFGLHVILICGLVASGNMKDINGALGKLKLLAKQQPIWALDSQAIMRGLQQGEAAIGWLGRGEHYQIVKGGGETKFLMPTEGGFFTEWAFAPVTNTKNIALAEQYANVALDPKLLAEYATHWGFNPTNQKWVNFADKETVSRIVMSDEQRKRMLEIDYAWLNSQRAELTDQWNRIVSA